MDLRKEQAKALKKAYAFAREGNVAWGQLWIDRAGHFLAVSRRQLAYANKLLNQARKAK